jgi:hypothetical protein
MMIMAQRSLNGPWEAPVIGMVMRLAAGAEELIFLGGPYGRTRSRSGKVLPFVPGD